MLFDKKYFLYLLAILYSFSCSNPLPLSNLFPDGTDKRNINSENPTYSGLQVGNSVPDLTFFNTDGTTETLSNILRLRKGVVIYFTMWCPLCETHMDYIRFNIKPGYPDIEFYLMDYVSATITGAQDNQTATGYTDFQAALDKNFTLTDLFYGTMGTTIVIDKKSVIKMNEDFKNGQRLSNVLAAIP
ncbi:MAG: redoxin family protein [Spirochaetia bacterium]|nr:redoxin family protein [Spirochaetia bacterium]